MVRAMEKEMAVGRNISEVPGLAQLIQKSSGWKH